MFRFQFRSHVVELQFHAQIFGGGFAVTGQNYTAQALIAQLLDDRRRLRADVVAQNDPAKQIAFGQPDFGKAGVRDRNLRDVFCAFALREPLAPSKQTILAVAFRQQTLAGDGFKMVERERLDLILFPVTRDGAGERMRGQFFK